LVAVEQTVGSDLRPGIDIDSQTGSQVLSSFHEEWDPVLKRPVCVYYFSLLRLLIPIHPSPFLQPLVDFFLFVFSGLEAVVTGKLKPVAVTEPPGFPPSLHLRGGAAPDFDLDHLQSNGPSHRWVILACQVLGYHIDGVIILVVPASLPPRQVHASQPLSKKRLPCRNGHPHHHIIRRLVAFSKPPAPADADLGCAGTDADWWRLVAADTLGGQPRLRGYHLAGFVEETGPVSLTG
jgi:hypothetical protein